MEECKYGCGRQGSYQLNNGGWCCSEHPTQCEVNKLKNSENNKKTYESGRICIFTDEHRKKSHISQLRNLKEKPFHLWGKRLIRKTILEEQNNECLICGIKKWNDKDLTLEIDHIDGDGGNNKRENLRAICPNCHSQTETYRGYNIDKNRVKITDEKIIEKIIENNGNITLTLKMLGLVPKGGNHIRVKSLINYDKRLSGLKEQMNQPKPVKPRKEKIKKIKKCECGVNIQTNSRYCKNCSQINQRKVERPPHKQLIKEVEELGYSGTGRKYGVTDNAIRKWLKNYEKFGYMM